MTRTTPNATLPISSRPPRGRWIACYAFLGAIFACVLVARWFLPWYVAEPIQVQRVGAPAQAGTAIREVLPALGDQRINPNTADWPELTRLPGIGEVTAKRIVAYREEHRDPSGSPVFRTAGDLARVHGIGPKTVEAMTPHLRFSDVTTRSSQ